MKKARKVSRWGRRYSHELVLDVLHELEVSARNRGRMPTMEELTAATRASKFILKRALRRLMDQKRIVPHRLMPLQVRVVAETTAYERVDRAMKAHAEGGSVEAAQ